MRKLFLAALAAGMLITAIATWGSMGSIAMVFGLLLMGASLLYQHFLTNREDNDFDLGQ